MRGVLAVGAHPDDVELGCGGALAAHHAAGDRVGVLVLTGGERGRGTTRQRRKEQERAAEVLGARLLWGGRIDCALTADMATVELIEEAITAVGAQVIYVHAPDDTHQDHRAAAAAVLGAARRCTTVLHYRSPSSGRFDPTVFIDIAAHLDRKLQALACHRTQTEGSAMVEPDVVVASARHFGAQARVQFAEAFSPARLVWELRQHAPEPTSVPPECAATDGALWMGGAGPLPFTGLSGVLPGP